MPLTFLSGVKMYRGPFLHQCVLPASSPVQLPKVRWHFSVRCSSAPDKRKLHRTREAFWSRKAWPQPLYLGPRIPSQDLIAQGDRGTEPTPVPASHLLLPFRDRNSDLGRAPVLLR